jgi:hypothetical protein
MLIAHQFPLYLVRQVLQRVPALRYLLASVNVISISRSVTVARRLKCGAGFSRMEGGSCGTEHSCKTAQSRARSATCFSCFSCFMFQA